MKISVTALSSFIYCPRKLYLQYIFGLREPMKEAVAIGAIKHSIMEEISNSEREIIESLAMQDTENIYEIFRSRFIEIAKAVLNDNESTLEKHRVNSMELLENSMPFIDAEASYIAAHVARTIKETNAFGAELWNLLNPKIKSEFSFESDKLMLKGRVDKIEFWKGDNETQKLIPFELKSGSMPHDGVWPSHRIQAAAYAMLLEEYYKTKVSKACIHYLDHNEVRDVVMNPFLRAEVGETTQKVFTLLRSSHIPELHKGSKCDFCGIRDECWGKQ